MSDLTKCIANGITEGAITPEAGARAVEDYRTFFDALEGVVPPDQQAKIAGKQTFDKLSFDAAERRRRLRLTEAKAARILGEIENYPGKDKAAAFKAYFYDEGFAQYANIRDRKQAVLGLAWAEMGDMGLDFMRGIFGGQRKKALLDDTIDEIFGKSTGNGKATDYAGRWYKASEMLRTLFNAEGGQIGKLDDWGLPTRHDASLFRRTSYDKWRDFTLPKLDRAKMRDRATGEPISDVRLDQALRAMFDGVRTADWTRKAPSRGAGGMSMANRRAEERFLIFKDGPSWRDYQETFGSGNPYHVMTEHLDDMARDIAAMQVFGPNPNATISWLGDVVKKDMALAADTLPAKKAEALNERAQSAVNVGNTMWRHYTGAVNSPVNVTVADLFTSVRNFLTGTLLGSTTLVAAPTDMMSQMAARRFAGLKQTGIIRDMAKQLNPASRKDRIVAIRSGMINDHVIARGLAGSRYTGERGARGISGQYADAALRINGLSQITQAGRHAMGLEFMGRLADDRDLPFDQLHKGLQRVLEKSGLKDDWDVLRRAPVDSRDGYALLNAPAIAKIPGLDDAARVDLSVRFLAGINAQVEYAVPTGSLRSRTFLQGDTAPGTLPGELIKSMTMFKSFPVAITYMHLARALALRAEKGGTAGAGYLMAIVSTYTLGGALAMQLGQVGQGKDPVDMTSAKFWGGAALKGGGLGIWGDILAQTDSQYDGLEASAAGPVAAAVQDVGELTVGNVLEVAKGDDPKLGRDAVRFTRNYMPFGRTWYLRLAKDRVLMDELQKMADPNAHQSFRRKVREAGRENSQQYWWAPGQMTPSRAPDMSEAVQPK